MDLLGFCGPFAVWKCHALQKGQLGRPVEEEERGGAAKDSKNSAFMPGAVPGIGL